ncbi:DMT family transporter [Gulosibacter molinativorax]|uniref:EamA/RhaT family transporter n=1 Tax=Gulosibacter molinativorax TaxID=256821 RepID=A0ABT7CAE5_9MICO|nr:DMT family transporter [Gulosibacter molinativorax]MDJ1372153.1 EamA/RhaT family transporter [Gulosibacter molinativorax]QUY60976.1 YoaV-like transporter [Gulosibacter molinativorax]
MNRTAIALFLTVSILWGIPYLFNEVALRELGPISVATLRVVLAALVLAPVLLTKGRWRVFQRHPIHLPAIALLQVVIPFILIATGQLTVPSGTAGILIATEPMFIAVLAPLLAKKPRMRALGWVGLVIGLAGVAGILGVQSAGPGVYMLIGASLSYAFSTVLIARWFADTDPLVLTAAMLLTAAPVLAAIMFIAEGPVTSISPPTGIAIAVLGVLCTSLAFVAYFGLIKAAGPTLASLITYTAPIVAVIAGVAFLGERFTLPQAGGCALVFLGAVLVTLSQRRSGTQPAS